MDRLSLHCCLGLVCTGAILSCSCDCNEQLAAHQALSSGPGFPGRSPGACVCVCVCVRARARVCMHGGGGGVQPGAGEH